MKARSKAQLPTAQTLLCAGLTPILAFGSGCPGECVGPGCDESYGATTLVVHAGGARLSTTRNQDPREGALVLEGALEQGQGWAPLLLGEALLLGLPALGEVRHLALDDLSLPSQGALDALGAQGTLLGARSGEDFGAALARVTTTGAADLWVGAPGATGGGNEVGAGAVYLFAGRGDGFAVALDSDRADLRLIGERAFDRFGERLSPCPDLDGDGLGELLVGATWEESGAALGGTVTLLTSGDRAGLGAEALAGELPHRYSATTTGAQLGRALGCSHDLTEGGGGTPDLVVGAPFADPGDRDAAGAVYLLAGEALPEAGDIATRAALTLEGSSAGDHLGAALASGDLDGDGAAELVVGAPGALRGAGSALVYAGADLAAGLRTRSGRIDGAEAGDHLGASLVLADLDGDGLLDLAVGAPRHNPTGEEEHFASGTVYLFLGASPLSAAIPAREDAAAADATLQAPALFLEAGQALGEGALVGAAEADASRSLLLLLSTEGG